MIIVPIVCLLQLADLRTRSEESRGRACQELEAEKVGREIWDMPPCCLCKTRSEKSQECACKGLETEKMGKTRSEKSQERACKGLETEKMRREIWGLPLCDLCKTRLT
jgi:hypothetical protein